MEINVEHKMIQGTDWHEGFRSTLNPMTGILIRGMRGRFETQRH